LKFNPNDAVGLNNLANVLIKMKDPQAVAVAERALAQSPSSAITTDTLGWALLQNGQIEKALKVLKDAKLRDPASSEIRYHLAAALAQAGSKKEAREELDLALKSGRSFEGVAEAAALRKSLD
jgi:cellulose synthase operon protein C